MVRRRRRRRLGEKAAQEQRPTINEVRGRQPRGQEEGVARVAVEDCDTLLAPIREAAAVEAWVAVEKAKVAKAVADWAAEAAARAVRAAERETEMVVATVAKAVAKVAAKAVVGPE